MRIPSIERLRCPVCLRDGVESRYEVDSTRVGGGEDGGTPGDLLEGFFVCLRCRAARPIVAGVPVLVDDLEGHLVAHGNVYRRVPIADPRVTRFVLGSAGTGGDVVPFEEVVTRYGDLLPVSDEAPARGPAPRDDLFSRCVPRGEDGRHLDGHGPALEIGCGVGRATFELARLVGDATGVDRSVARVRRARNVQTAEEFSLPIRPGARVETPIHLGSLHRDGVDFVVADPFRLPFAGKTFGLVVLREGDGDGPWRDAAAVRAEAERVLAADGELLEEQCGLFGTLAADEAGDDGPDVA